jgi:hypothetical protein
VVVGGGRRETRRVIETAASSTLSGVIQHL